MPMLLDPPPAQTVAFLQVIARGFAAAGGQWPIWQYVERHLDDAEIDADEVLRRLPEWRHHYRYVICWGSTGGALAPPGRIGLTIAGIFHAREPVTDELLKAFLAALAEACAAQRTIEPMPTEPVSVGLCGRELTESVVRHAAANVSPEQLVGLLRSEPATWSQLHDVDTSEWTWDLTRARLRPYRGIVTGEQFLTALEDLVGLSPAAAEPVVLPPTALPEALDHLDLAWRLLTGTPLVRITRAMLPAVLTQPAASAEEFESRCSALADVMNSLCTGTPEQPSLHGLKAQLADRLGERSGRAREAVDVLRHIVAVRVGQQHRGADQRAQQARSALGLTAYASDWTAEWEHLRVVTVQALTTIREEITELIGS